MSKIRLNINGMEVLGYKGQSILDIARENEIDIPTLCYDERVKAYGSCGLCVVEAEGIPKLLRACATEAAEGMIIQTHTKKVHESRKIALELLLSDHEGDCRPPCVLACPGGTDCQGYVGLIANGEYEEALKLIKEQLPLPASIGRVCPHPCETACRRKTLDEPISIAFLKSFVADLDLKEMEAFIPDLKESTGKTVGIIGGGPSGLTAAYYLAMAGHKPVIYEAMPKMGGMLRYGIPQYRLPKEVLDKEIDVIRQMGVEMITDVKIGKDVQLDHLRNKHDAIYIAIGAWRSTKLNCPGENLDGVIGGIDFLRKITINEPVETGQRIAVVGGGNTAMDACRTAIRLGAKEVYNIYRRTKEEMPAEDIEILEAEEEGVVFKFLVNPIEILGENGRVTHLRLQKMTLGEPDERGRRRPMAVEGEEEVLEVDSVIAAIGQQVDITGLEEVSLTRWGTISSDEKSYRTNLEDVFAGGDATNDGPGIAITAIGEGKKAADVISSYLEGHMVPYEEPYYVTREDVPVEEFAHRETEKRVKMRHLSPEERRGNFQEILAGFSEEEAKKEAMRCLECGCHDVFECKLLSYANAYAVNPEPLEGEKHHRMSDDGHPFIIRNSDKCILCGLCVRVCDEVIGKTALGLIDRGFDTVVKPAFNLDLKDTDCISCGQCIDVCPTGALQERLKIEKSVPLEGKLTKTVCSHCSVGCKMDLSSKGNTLVKALPKKETAMDEGLLCVKGKFGCHSDLEKRIVKPMIRKNGVLEEVSMEEALLYTAKKVQSIGALYGSNSIGLSISDRYTNEEIYIASSLGKDIFKTSQIASFNYMESGLKRVLGRDASPNTLDEILGTDLILLIGSDLMENHTVAGLKIKKAVEKGARLVFVNEGKLKSDHETAHTFYSAENIEAFLLELEKALIENGYGSKGNNFVGLDEVKTSLENIIVSEEAREIAEIYGKAKKAMIVFEQKLISPNAASLIGNIAVLTGHVGKARSGILEFKQNNNSQGLVDLGISLGAKDFKGKLSKGELRGLMVFGEDLPQVNLEKLEFLMVQDLYLTKTAAKADVVLPAVSFAESKGSYTNTERKIQKINRAIDPVTQYENWKIISAMGNLLDISFKYNSVEEIAFEIQKEIPAYAGYHKISEPSYWPIGASPVLYGDGFAFEDGKARLQVVSIGEGFETIANTNAITNAFVQYIGEEKLV